MMTAIFPTIGELLLPNFNITSIIGFVLIVIGVLVLVFTPSFLKKTFVNLQRVATLTILVGVVLVWGVSIIQDFVTSTGGALIVWLSVILVIAYLVLFRGKNNKKQGVKLF